MQDYPPIAEHGLIGDLQTAALVTTDGSIDWFCCPRFDSPSVFGSLLDINKGGHFRISPVDKDYVVKQLYLPDTAVLVTRFMTHDGVGELLDFMPPTGRQATDNHRLVRLMRCVRGRINFEADIAPRFDYGRQSHETHVTEHGVVFVNPSLSLTLHTVRDRTDERLAKVSRTDSGDVHVTFELRAGQQRGLVMESAASGPPREIPNQEFDGLLDDTSAFWRGWLAQSTYTGRWRETLRRSAVALKLMTYAPTGALVAAPTAGLPEQVGGERNWDYRYTWVRDASFSVYALLGMGFTEEAADFCGWLRERVVEKVGGEGGPLNIMYRVDGSSDLVEFSLDHWEGYRGSSPVRIGNGASDQRQMDIYGEALDSIYFADQNGIALGHDGWIATRSILDWLTDNWDQKGAGIWETRGGPQDFTYGRVMSWTATGRSGWPPSTAAPPTGRSGREAATTSTGRSGTRAGARSAEPSCSTTATTCWTRRCSGWRPSGSSRRATRSGSPPSAPWMRSWSQTAWCTATTRPPRRTVWPGTRGPSRCARSTTWTRSVGPAGWTMPD
jgi:GH15 family glucan-1,4-alpha-glucosidase